MPESTSELFHRLRDREGRPAVLKLQPAGREDTLRVEHNLLGKLRHPQLPRPLAYLEFEGREYLVREYIEGISLAEQVDAQGPLAPAQVRETALSLCRVLDYLHRQEPPVICRDIKPQNVVLDPSGCCHLIDLGAARRYRAEQREDTVFLGTQATAPPEQFGYQQTDQRSDVYSLGMLLRFLLSGSYDPLSGRPGRRTLARIIRRCTAFAPQNRYPSVRAVYRALKCRRQRWIAAAATCGMCAPLLDFSYDSFTMNLTEPLTYEAGAVAAVRLFESLPETAWATIDRLNGAELNDGDAVFFRRGDVWRAAQVESRPGVTYSAYGEGEKPGLYGSAENGGGAEKWSLWYEGEDGRKIWVYYRPMLDCGAIALKEDLAAEKVQPFWNGQTYQVLSDLWLTDQTEQAAEEQAALPEFDPAVHLTEDLTFFSQASGGLPDTLPIYLLGWVDTGEDVAGYFTGAFTIDGGPNMQDGTVEVRDNVFFAARESLVYIRTYAPEYLPDFEGNCYAQFSDGVFFSSVSAPCCWSGNAREGVRELLGDERGEVLSLSRSRWGEIDW